MAGYGYRRYMIDLAIPYDENGNLPPGCQGQLNAIEQHVRTLQSFSEKINEGLPYEEDTTWAKWHICHHDTGDQLCEEEQEI